MAEVGLELRLRFLRKNTALHRVIPAGAVDQRARTESTWLRKALGDRYRQCCRAPEAGGAACTGLFPEDASSGVSFGRWKGTGGYPGQEKPRVVRRKTLRHILGQFH